MKVKPHIDYDEEADVLYITFGSGEPSYGDPVDGFFLIERGMKTDKVTGCRLIGLKKWLTRETKTMWVARVKYSRIAIPEEKKFKTKEEAEKYCREKELYNPYVRWTKVDTKIKYKKNKKGGETK